MKSLHDHYLDYCFKNNIVPATKATIATLITKLYPGVTKQRHKGTNFTRNRPMIYHGIGFRSTCNKDINNTITLPPFCSATGTDGLLSIKVPTEYTVNGKSVYFNILCRNDNLNIQLHDQDIPLASLGIDQRVTIDQMHLDKLINLVQKFEICKGEKFSSDSLVENFTLEIWATVRPSQMEPVQNVRSMGCNGVLKFTATGNLCDNCRSVVNRCRFKKRRLHDCGELATSNQGDASAKHNDTDHGALVNISNQTVATANGMEHNDNKVLGDISNQFVPVQATATKRQMEKTENNVDTNIENSTVANFDDGILMEPSDNQKMENILSQMLPNAPAEAKTFLEAQLRVFSSLGKDPRGRRWSPDIIRLSLALYARSPQCYRDLTSSEMLILPSDRTLRYYKNIVDQKPGLNRDNLTWMYKEAQRQKISKSGLRGGLIIDEMSVQDDIKVVRRGDLWNLIGATDVGHTCNNINILIKQGKNVEMASHVLQLVFLGFEGFRWPVAFFATGTATAHQLYKIIWDTVDLVEEHGFTIDYLMLDGASTNRAFTAIMLPNPRLNQFTVTNPWNALQLVTIVQDIKHVLKKIRNGLESSRKSHKSYRGRYLLKLNNEIIWDHWIEAFGYNMQNGIRIHRKLTNEHIELSSSNKMRNHLALEVLNRDMLHLMKIVQDQSRNPEEYNQTVCLLEHTSVLVEIFSDPRPVSDMKVNQFSLVLINQFLNCMNKLMYN